MLGFLAMIPRDIPTPTTFGRELSNPLELRRPTVGLMEEAPLKCAGILNEPPICQGKGIPA